MTELLYRPEDHKGLPWAIRDEDITDFSPPPMDQIIDMTGIITAPWGVNGAQLSICWYLALTFEGIKKVKGVPTGLFSIVVQPKDSVILHALTQEVGRAKSPRVLLKDVVATLIQFPMYPGARLDLIGAHYGSRGGKMLFMQASSTAGWDLLVARRNAEISRFSAQQKSFLNRSVLDMLSDWWHGVSAPIAPVPLSVDSPRDDWQLSVIADQIQQLIAGQGLNAGPLNQAGMALFRRIGRDDRLKRVMAPFERGGGTIAFQDDLMPAKGGRRTLTMIQLD